MPDQALAKEAAELAGLPASEARLVTSLYEPDQTFAEFADAWVSAKAASRQLLSAEYAFLTDLRRGQAGPDWKSTRNLKAERVLATLEKIATPPEEGP